MNKKMHKRIIGLLVIIFAFVIYAPFNVSADACDTERAKFESTGYQKYGISIDYDTVTDTYTMKMNPSSLTGVNNPTFKITKIVANDGNTPATVREFTGDKISLIIGNTTTISPNNIIKFSRTNSYIGFVPRVLNITLEPVGFDDPDLKSACKGKAIPFTTTLSITVDRGKTGKVIKPTFEFGTVSIDNNTLDCANYTKYPTDSFEYSYCRDWNAAEVAGAKIEQFTNDKREYSDLYGNKALELRCDYKINNKNDIFEKSIYLADGKTPNPNYYKNINYFRGSSVRTESVGSYQYHEESTGKVISVAATCDIACNEVVTVEYGAPIATKGGACFEYKVRVTSRVSCDLKKEPDKPKTPIICTPTPICKSSSSSAVTHNAAGPNEDFDQCVKKCDGGRYSDKCTNKCYKDVYGKSVKLSGINKTAGVGISYANKVVNLREDYYKMYDNTPTNAAADQCLYVKDGDDITWVTNTGTVRMNEDQTAVISCDSSWHINNIWGFWDSVYSLYKPSGIPSTDVCSETCSWYENDSPECTSGENIVYLNDSETYNKYHADTLVKDENGKDVKPKTQYDIDMDANIAKYNELKGKCEAAVTCNTSTAEFTISVNIKSVNSDNTVTETKINYPYEQKDTIKYNGTTGLTTCTDDDKFTTVLNSAGCYNCGKKTSDKFYQTEWTFPGTWRHLKSGDIEYYGQKITTTGWDILPYKFCLPFNAASVNTKWYNYYQAKVNGLNPNISYNDTAYISTTTCPDGSPMKCDYANTYKNSTFTDKDAESIDKGGSTEYNINASTRKFGYYGWDINISCFYALNKEPEDCGCKGDDDAEYRIRPVDLENAFPDADGNALSSSDKTGRVPGFNWSKYATQETKDASYKSVPTKYTTWIQAKGYSVYSDEYLDYEVLLTKEKITEIKKSDVNYTNWKGIVNNPAAEEIKSASTYQSRLIRDEIKNAVYPNYQALQCNNIGKHTIGADYSAECEEFTGEVK